MARSTKPLTDREIKASKPKEKKYKLIDGGGLFLLITPQGGKQWKLKYRFNNKEREYSIGTYPTISLNKARSIREELKIQIAEGIDPSQKKKETKQKTQEQQAKKENTFEKISKEWVAFKDGTIKEITLNKHQSRLDLHIYPYFKNISIDEIKAKDIIDFLKDRDKDGVGFETIDRCKSLMDNILRYSLNHGYIEFNPASSIKTQEIVKKTPVTHRPQIKDPKRVLELIDNAPATYFTKKAMQLLPYVFFRNENITQLKWEYIDFEKNQIVIPADKMKEPQNGDMIMPFTDQTLKLLKQVYEHKINDFVFPSSYHNSGISENTINKAYKKMGLKKGEISTHSWRNLFRTTVEENQHIHRFSKSVMKALMHHAIADDSVEAAYNRATYDEAKRELIQWYADYIDENYREL